MAQAYAFRAVERDYSDIGYYGRPITALSREELLTAFAELIDIYKELENNYKKSKEALGVVKFEAL